MYKNCMVGSGKWPLMDEETSRGAPADLGNAIKWDSHLAKREFWYTNIKEGPTGERSAVLALAGANRLSEKRAYEGRPVSVPKLKKYDKSQRKAEVRRRELDLCQSIKNELDAGLIHYVLLVAVSISEVKGALGSEQDWSRNLEYF